MVQIGGQTTGNMRPNFQIKIIHKYISNWMKWILSSRQMELECGEINVLIWKSYIYFFLKENNGKQKLQGNKHFKLYIGSMLHIWNNFKCGLVWTVSRSMKKENCLNIGTWIKTAITDEKNQSSHWTLLFSEQYLKDHYNGVNLKGKHNYSYGTGHKQLDSIGRGEKMK